MFTLRKIEIDSKHDFIALMMEEDARELSLRANERIKIFHGNQNNKNFVICELEIVDYKKRKGSYKDLNLKKGEIGVLESAFDKLNLDEGKKVNISVASKPKSLEYVKKKFNGHRLSEDNFLEIAQEIIDNKYSDVETTYFVLACTAHKLNDKETIGLTKAMVKVGKMLDFKEHKDDIVVDKHCIGGVPNNRTTMLVVPIIAAAGLKIPKTSSRSITSPAGTADTMEVFANVDIGLSKMYDIVNNINGCIVWGGALDLSPADDIIIHVEHPLEIDSQGQMIASILSKKKSAGSTHVLIDIPVGKNTKVKNYLAGLKLKKRFEKVGRAIGLKIEVIITDGSSPIGSGIGPLYEARNIMSILKRDNGHDIDLKEKSLMMAGKILELAKYVKSGNGYSKAKEILESGLALDKFEQILNAQGRKKEFVEAKYNFVFKSKIKGKLKEINNKKISKLAFILGAPEDKSAGLIMNKKVNDKLEISDDLIILYTNSLQKLKFAKNYLQEHDDIFIIR